MQLSNARVLVTGGSEGIGFAIGEALASKGARVALMSRRSDPLESAARSIGATAILGDVGNEGDAARAVAVTVETFGGLDILVNNAGFGTFQALVDIDTDSFLSVLRTNVTGAMFMAREAARVFVKQGSGNIVNISSTSGLKGGRGASAYVASKFALRGMTECWRDELRRHNVRVMLVNPSEVQTSFFSKVGREQEQSPKKLRGEDIADAIVGALEMDDRGFIPEFSVWATNPF
jgi:3-oxoacyl-[acyl-carrier protein] reductase